ncbi:LysR substrate-binding domain-containing protein [Rhodovarius crocodyli]|nr:LysR substrate-binding domain-containing protein [Rhodovarius crocodyli]
MASRSLEFRHLEAFRAIMRTGSVTGAGAMLGTSQPAVSRLLSQIEQIAGFALFERVRGRLVPNAMAEALHKETERVFIGIDEVTALAERLRAQAPRRIVMASLPTLTLSLLPRAIAAWRTSGRRETMSIHSRAAGGVLGLVSSRQADIGISNGLPRIPGVRSAPLMRTRAWCVMPPGHRFAARPVVRAADLDGEAYIALSREEGRQARVDDALMHSGARPDEAVECRMTVGAVAMAAAGNGVTVADAFAVASCLHLGLVLRPFEPAVTFDYRIIWPEEMRDNFGRAALAQSIRATARQLVEEVAAHAAGSCPG